jgi:Protein of unknown function (DUF1353)
MNKLIATTFVTFVLVLMSGSVCAQSYNDFEVGTLSGKTVVEWYKPDLFIYTPHPKSPLTFTRKNGVKIIPGRMFTDGGSIPRPLWMLPKFSPWGYGPAFVVHDWLFTMQHCKYEGYESFDHHIAATVMAEVMKTMMETKVIDSVDPWTLETMYWAVDSRFAEKLWNNGRCTPPPSEFRSKNLIKRFVVDVDVGGNPPR